MISETFEYSVVDSLVTALRENDVYVILQRVQRNRLVRRCAACGVSRLRGSGLVGLILFIFRCRCGWRRAEISIFTERGEGAGDTPNSLRPSWHLRTRCGACS